MSDSPPPRQPADHLTGLALVLLQFALIGAIAWRAGPSFLALQASTLAWVVLAAAVALGAWALSANRPGNFNIRPVPKAGGQLVRSGPYAYIRHPMYTAVLLAGLAGVYGVDIPGRMLVGTAFFALLAVLWVKAGLEERWMAAQHPDYAAYQKESSRFIPWLM
jgi:protein-S-isoprenylcysteine O-methyltransferase Ste14